MLQENITDFLDACKQNNFPAKSLESFSLRLLELDATGDLETSNLPIACGRANWSNRVSIIL